MIDPTFRNINRLFDLSFKNDANDYGTTFIDDYYMQLVEIKDFNALIDNKLYFDQHVENMEESYGKLVKMSRNYNYATPDLLYFLYHDNYYKLMGKNLSMHPNMNISQQINFTEKLKNMMVQIYSSIRIQKFVHQY